ncbi:MAG: glutamate synthase subunit beta [Candidatus Omnitrophota bacterium]
MGDPKGFLKHARVNAPYRPIKKRVGDYKHAVKIRRDKISTEQALRCMDCGTPFCHWGCPAGNYIPEWNNSVAQKQWKKAFHLLSQANCLPEITGRICPAICEYACVLGINDDPITIRENELAIIEYAFKKNLIKPNKPAQRTNKKIAVVGSGPAGLACASELNRLGHSVTVFERDDKVGGILRYGIPDFKLEKWILDRRLKLLKKEGIIFKTSVDIGRDYSTTKLKKDFSAICLATGSRTPRDLKIPGRESHGIHFAMDYLKESNLFVQGKKISRKMNAKGKKVVVIGGGDTGADCVGVANRQKASSIIQIEVLPKPPKSRTDDFPWPSYPVLLKESSSHQEGCKRFWSILTKKFTCDENNHVKKISCVKVEFIKTSCGGYPQMKEIPGSEFEIEADLIILAIGFLHPESELISLLNIEIGEKKCIKTDQNYMTSLSGVFAAGDAKRGQSLAIWAISEGRACAQAIHEYLNCK